MTLVEKLDSDVQVQNCTVLRQSTTLPAWLNGTPIYVDQDAGYGPLRGGEAIRALQELLETERAEKNEESRGRAPARPPGAPPRMQPSMTRQPSEQSREDAPATTMPPQMDEIDEAMDTMANGASSNAGVSDAKVTDDMLQRYMEARNSSPASAGTVATV